MDPGFRFQIDVRLLQDSLLSEFPNGEFWGRTNWMQHIFRRRMHNKSNDLIRRRGGSKMDNDPGKDR